MSRAFPEAVDPWRMVAGRRIFGGQLPLAGFSRLAGMLDQTDGSCRFELEFGRDPLGLAYLDVAVDASLPLVCQRTLEPFERPVRVRQRLGLIRSEAEERSLPAGWEPLLVAGDEPLRLVEVIEDELILAVPLVPMREGAKLDLEFIVTPDEDPVPEGPVSPFAALAALKRTR